VIPHQAHGGTVPIATLGALCVVFGGVLIAMPDRLPERVLPAMLAAGAVLVSLGIVFSGDASSPYAFFYVWVAVEAFFFLGGRAAVSLVGFIGVCYAAALLALPSAGGDAIVRWLFTVGACLVSSVMAGVLQARAQVLLDEASEAARTDALTGLLNRRGFEETILLGKLGVPDEILRKPGRLTEAEFTEIRKHPELGARILAGANLDDISGWVLAHHERPDGAGYPFGLSAEQIPLEARILAVADAFEAMTADRVYRAGMPRDAAVQELRRCCATQFDETVVYAFLRRLGSPVSTASGAAFR
jgi:uncharacterized membrane protein (DUF485 family)